MGVNGIYGLSGSGLDIESLVKVGMMSKQSEYDKMAQKYTKNEWTKTAYVELNSQITTFSMTKLHDYKLSTNMKAKTASSSDETAVTATASGSAVAMPHRVDVDQLSTNAYLISGKKLSEIIAANGHSDIKDTSIKLSDVLFKDFGCKDLYVDSGTSYTSTTTTSTKTEGYTLGTDVSVKTVTNNDGTKDTTINLGEGKELTVNTSSDGNITTYKTQDGKSMTLTKQNGFTAVTFSDGQGGPTSTMLVITAGGSDGTTLSFGDSGFPKINLNGNTVTLSESDDNNSIALTQAADGSIASVKQTVNGTETTSDTKTITEDTSKQEINLDNGKKITLTTKTDGTIEALYNDGTTDFTGTVKTETIYTGIGQTFTAGKTLDDGGKMFFTYVENGKEKGITLSKDSDTGIITATLSADKRTGLVGVASNGTKISEGFDALTGYEGKDVKERHTAIKFTVGDGSKDEKGNKIVSSAIEITFKELRDGFTATDLVSKINDAAKAKDLKVRATYENLSGRFFLYNSESGSEDRIEINAVSDAVGTTNYKTDSLTKIFFDSLDLRQSEDGTLNTVKEANGNAQFGSGNSISVGGTDGKARIDGVEYSFQDNKLQIDSLGVTYNFNRTTTQNAYNADGNLNENRVDNPVTVTVGQDTDAIVNRVKTFIEDYNKLLSSLYEKYDEKSDSNYKPLTQSQKDSMKEEQITKWEEKAKQGLLYHDSTLSKIIGDMRESITRSVELDDGSKVSIFSLGVSTTGIKGQLTLDEDKLKKALNEDPDIVYNVFGRLGDTKETGIVDKNGIAQRLGDVFNSATKAIKTRAGSSADIAEDSDLNNLLRELQTKMSNFKKLMSSFEDRLYKKYDAMEVALTKLGSQLSFITGGQ